jgi:hypothetical protein
MKERHAAALADLLGQLRSTGSQFPVPTKKEILDGFQLMFFNGTRGLSIIHHDGSYDLETAEIIGNSESFVFADQNPCTQVKGHRETSEVVQDIVNLFPLQLPN